MRNNPMGLLKRDKRHAFSYAFISLCNHESQSGNRGVLPPVSPGFKVIEIVVYTFFNRITRKII